jgi:hypothetical protein
MRLCAFSGAKSKSLFWSEPPRYQQRINSLLIENDRGNASQVFFFAMLMRDTKGNL